MSNAFIQFGNMIPGVVSQQDSDPDHKPRDVRAKLYEQMPAEYMQRYPLTKMVMSKRGKIAGQTKVEWGMQAMNDRVFAVEEVHDNANMSSLVSGETAAGATVYLLVSEADAQKLRPLEEAEIRHCAPTGVQGYTMVDIAAIDSTNVSPGKRRVTATVLEADEDQALAEASLLQGTVTSMAVPEGSKLPPGKFQEPTMHFNYSQIIMAGLSVTGSELADISYFDETVYDRYLRQTHEDFNAQVENALKFGVRKATTATVNIDGYEQTVKRHKMGGMRWMHRNLGGHYLRIPNVTSFGGTSFSGKTWNQASYEFLKVMMYELGKAANPQKVLLASGKVMLDISNMFESMTNVTIGSTFKNAWGFEVTEVRGLGCRLQLLQDAGLSFNSGWEDLVMIVEPERFEMRPRKGRDMTLIRSSADLKKLMKIENGFEWRDALKEGIVADFSFTVDNLDGMAFIEGWGRDFGTE